MSGPRTLAATGLLLLVCHLIAMQVFRKPDGRVIFGDATHHFVQLRSMVFDRDLDFENDYLGMYGISADDSGAEWLKHARTPTGLLRNYMPIGPALAWLPLYLVGTAGLFIASVMGLAPPPDGFDRLLQLVPGVTGVVMATLAAIAAWHLARRHVADRAATWGVLGVWLGSHASYYTLVSPAYSHTASMFAASLFFLHWWTTRERPSIGSLAASGALAGLASLMRWQDAIFLIIPCVEILRWRAPFATRAAAVVAVGTAFVIVFSPQMIVWTVLYGQPLAMPQGAGFMRWTSPHPIDVLFSDNHGLFTWAPLLAPALVGLVSALRTRRAVAVPIALVLLATWYTNAAVADWWAGEAFGARRFLSLFALFGLGLSTWLDRPRSAWRLGTLIVLFAGNWLLLLQYQLFMKGLTTVAPYPAGWFDMFIARLIVPVRLIASWLG